MSKQPRDDGNDPIPVLGLRPNRGLQVPFTSSSNTSPQISNDDGFPPTLPPSRTPE